MTDYKSIFIIEIIIGSLSLLGSFFNIFCFVFFKSLRCFALEIVFYLSLSCMLTNITYLINIIQNEEEERNNTLCKIQGFSMIWFELSQSIWATLIAYSISKNVINYDKKVEKTQLSTRLTFIFLGYVSPLSISLFAYFSDMIGPSGNWCWIKTTDKDTKGFVYVMIVYGIMWLMFFISVCLIVKVVHFLKNLYISQDEKELIIKYTTKLRVFPLIQMLTLIPCTVQRSLDFFGIKIWDWSEYLIIILISSQGFLYAIVYGFNPKVRNKLSQFVQKFICCRKHEEKESLISMNTEIIDFSDTSLFKKKENGENV